MSFQDTNVVILEGTELELADAISSCPYQIPS